MNFNIEIAAIISKEDCNPEFWLRALEQNIYLSECPEKQKALQNSHDKLRLFILEQSKIVAKADAEIASLKDRIREMTEFRPMETAPSHVPILTQRADGMVDVSAVYDSIVISRGIVLRDATGWLPLPARS